MHNKKSPNNSKFISLMGALVLFIISSLIFIYSFKSYIDNTYNDQEASVTDTLLKNKKIKKLKKDIIPPSLRILSPATGKYSGTVHFCVEAKDNAGISKVELNIDGIVVRTFTTQSSDGRYCAYVGGSDKTAIQYPNKNTTHSFGARAIDNDGNITDDPNTVTIEYPRPVTINGKTYIQFIFATVPGNTYTVEKTNDIAPQNGAPIVWQDVNTLMPIENRGVLTNNGSAVTYLAPAVGEMGFFRVIETTPFTLTVTKIGTGHGDVASFDNTISCLYSENCTTKTVSYSPGTTVNLVAYANGDSIDTNPIWGGDALCGNNNQCMNIVMDSAKNITVTFTANPIVYKTITVIKNGQGIITSIPAGILCGNGGNACIATFPQNTQISLNTTPFSGYTFSNWTGEPSCNTFTPCIVTVNTDKTITANFTADPVNQPPIANAGADKISTVNTSVSFSGALSSDLDGTITNYSWDFGDGTNGTGISTSHTYTTTGNKTVTHTVTDNGGLTSTDTLLVTINAPTNYTLSVQRNGTGGGVVRTVPPSTVIYCSPTNQACSAPFVSGTLVTLSAIADSGSTFDGWGGACLGTQSTCAVLMDSAKTVTAVFTALPATQRPPWRNFDLSKWKIQLTAKPTYPTDIFPLNFDANAASMSPWWYTDATDPLAPMVFALDSYLNPPSGTNLRSELREVINGYSNTPNWNPLVGVHNLKARIKVRQITGMPSQITVLQIHPYANINPLLRISWNLNTSNPSQSTIKAFYKTDDTGNATLSVTCSSPSPIGFNAFDAEVIVENQQLKVNINGIRCLTKDIAYWYHEGYFKAGSYPQAYAGLSEVRFYRLEVTHLP